MAIFHLHASIISRKSGGSSVRSAAYRSGEKLTDERTGEVHDYTKKRGIYDSAILAPDYAPDWVYNRETLWNRIEAIEKRYDAQLARDIDLALPVELSHFQKRSLVREFFQRECVERGMVVDLNLHDFNSKNPHVHAMLSLRHLTEAGFGNKNRDWNDREFLQQLRSRWSDAVNLALERAGHKERIDHRSLAAQGSNLIAQIHLGPNVCQMEKRGIATERGDIAREIDKSNAQIKSLDIQLKSTTTLIDLERERERQREQVEAEARVRKQQEEREAHDRAQRQAAEAQRQAQIEHLNSLVRMVANDLRQQTDQRNSTAKSVELPQPEVLASLPDYAAEITPIAAQLFEFYAAQGEPARLNAQEWIYEVNADDRVYWLSRNEATGEYNLRGKDRDFDLLLNRGVTKQDRDIWRDWGNWLDQQAQQYAVEVAQPAPVVPITDQAQLERAARRILAERGVDDGNGGRSIDIGSYRVSERGTELLIQGLSSQKQPIRVILQQGQLAAGAEAADAKNLEHNAGVVERLVQHERTTAIAAVIRRIWMDTQEAGEIRGKDYMVQQRGKELHLVRLNQADTQSILILPLDNQQPAIGRGLSQADCDRFKQVGQDYEAALAKLASQTKAQSQVKRDYGIGR